MGTAFRRSLHGFGSTCKRSPGGGFRRPPRACKGTCADAPAQDSSGDRGVGASHVGGCATDRPFIAAIAISKARGGLPAPGFFDCARRLGRFAGDASGLEAQAFHAQEFNAAVAFWAATATNGKSG